KENLLRPSLRTLRFLWEDFDAKQKKAEAQVVQQVMVLINHALTERPPGPLYFGGSTDQSSLLDFLLWRHQADQLGIQLTEHDVKILANRESLGQLDGEQKETAVRTILGQQGRGLSFETLLAALRDEFRVRMAQSALLGYDPGSHAQVPTPITPEEF